MQLPQNDACNTNRFDEPFARKYDGRFPSWFPSLARNGERGTASSWQIKTNKGESRGSALDLSDTEASLAVGCEGTADPRDADHVVHPRNCCAA